MPEMNHYKYLEPRPGSSVRQPFVKGRNIWAEVLYSETIGEDARTPEQVAADFEVPLGAVLEAIDFCVKNRDYLREELERQNASLQDYLKEYPPPMPPWMKPAT
jgi:uncharacterized protein (DUF433 family)